MPESCRIILHFALVSGFNAEQDAGRGKNCSIGLRALDMASNATKCQCPHLNIAKDSVSNYARMLGPPYQPDNTLWIFLSACKVRGSVLPRG